MATPTATVFGGSGFVGRYTVGELARRGYRVRVAVRRPDRALFLKPMGDVGQITPMAANIRDDASVADAVEGADAVINLVGVLYEAGQQRFHAVHAEGAGRIARAAAAAGVERMVPCFRHRRRARRRRRIRAQQGGWRRSGAGSIPRQRRRPAEHRVWNRGRFSQSLCVDCAPGAGHSPDRRRQHQIPAGLCRRCRGGDHAYRRGLQDFPRHLRIRRAEGLQLQGADGSAVGTDREEAVVAARSPLAGHAAGPDHGVVAFSADPHPGPDPDAGAATTSLPGMRPVLGISASCPPRSKRWPPATSRAIAAAAARPVADLEVDDPQQESRRGPGGRSRRA